MNGVELEFPATPAAVSALEERLFDLGATSVVLVDAGDQPLLEPPPNSHPLWDQITVKALFDGILNAELAWAALRSDNLVDPNSAQAHFTPLDNQDWVRAGLAGLGPVDCGHGLWIVPSWEELPEHHDAVCVHLDPGLAFGTGTHPTTAMCLAALAENPPRGQRVLDYGCGSGILALAALRLGAAHAVAVDIDPQAIQATQTNAEQNDLGASIRVGTPDLLIDTAPFDWVLANILADPLCELAPRMAELTRPGGRIVLAGLLERHTERVSEAYARDFSMATAAMREGWILLVGQRRGNSHY